MNIVNELNRFHNEIAEWFKNPIVIDLGKKYNDSNKNDNVAGGGTGKQLHNSKTVKYRNGKKLKTNDNI